MTSRRNFLKSASLVAAGFPFIRNLSFPKSQNSVITKPIVLATWWFGEMACEEAWKVLKGGGWALDAVEAGVRVPEADPKVTSVGYGGLPDRDGNVTLDACIMDENSNCGSVAFLQNIMHPISVARKVMEKTPHIYLVGEGAYKFARENNFPKENLLTPESEKEYNKWKNESNYKPAPNEDHDTIGMIALDSEGRLSGACTTSGMRFKINGRVGDSPIIGAGLFVDGEIGAATATGVGEEVIRIAGSHTIVEMMRQGYSPIEACKATVERCVRKMKGNAADTQVGFLALNKDGDYGGYAIQKGFQFTVYSDKEKNILKDSDYLSR